MLNKHPIQGGFAPDEWHVDLLMPCLSAHAQWRRADCNIVALLGDRRIIPFPQLFKELLAMHADTMKKKQAIYLFESTWKKKYTDRGIRKILAKYSAEAQLTQNLSPHKLRYFLLTWHKKQGIDDALIQPYSGHESRKSLEVYSKLAIVDAQNEYNEVINKFPI